jgi:hypothetical protein
MRGWSRVDLQTSAFCFAKSPQFLAVSLIGIKSRCVWIERTYIDMLLRDDLVESDKIAIAMVVIPCCGQTSEKRAHARIDAYFRGRKFA